MDSLPFVLALSLFFGITLYLSHIIITMESKNALYMINKIKILLFEGDTLEKRIMAEQQRNLKSSNNML